MNKPQASVKVPEPRQLRRRPSAVTRVFIWTFVLLIFAVIAVGGASYYAFQQYTAPGPLAEAKVFVVEQGGVSEVADSLEKNGIIANGRIFSVMASVTGTRSRLKAGEYEFAAGASMRDVMALIASGKSITYKLLVPEGWTSQMAVERVNANEILTGPPATIPAEGAIMPDTYVFRRGMTRQKLVEDMQTAQKKLVQELWDKRVPNPVIETPEQAVILASIVEKETGVGDERPIIASVFINRLRKGMRLQSDPTIIYGIVGGKGKLDRPLTRNDIETETPYNTYRIDGLPPGPIANPGRAAIEAVLNPQTTDYLYFVADGTGGHAFATTLDEHNRNVRKWRQIAGNAAAAAAADDGEAPAASESAPADASTPATDAAAPAAADAAGEVAPAPAELPPPEAPAPALQNAVEPAPEAVIPKPDAAATTAPAPDAAANAEPPKKPPVPVQKPARAANTLKPGDVVTVDGKLVVIPKRNPRR